MPSKTINNQHWLQNIAPHWDKIAVWGLGVLCMLSVALAIRYNTPMFYAIPLLVIGATIAIFDFKKLYFLLFASIPLSVEIYLPGGLATDLPSEPLMWVLMGVTFIYVLLNFSHLSALPFRHPITLLLLAHFAWIITTTITSEQFVFSLKYSLAKVWYLTVFYFLSLKIFKKEESSIKKMVYPTLTVLTIVMLICLVRHAGYGFSFTDVNRVVGPFFQNHVVYAALPSVFVPFAWYATYWHRRWSFSWWIIIFAIAILILGIQFSYTRTAYVALMMAVGAKVVIRLRLMKWVLIATTIGAVAGVFYIIDHNRFLEYAPNFSKAVSHESFDNLINATYKLEDISTMERVYRWVAAGHMVSDKPYMGFGPGNFYSFYKNYTVSSFRTYVSDNPERSSTHCYFLMVWAEQGIFGLLFFVAFCFGVLLLGERVYHQTQDLAMRRVSLMATLSFVINLGILLINDMVETDKLGSFFFLSAAILVSINIRNRVVKVV